MANIICKNLSRIGTKLGSYLYKRNPNLWVFGEWMGNRICDNSLYFANYIAKEHPEIDAVWIARKNIDTSLLDASVRIVEMDTREAEEILKHAGVAVMNQGYVDFSSGNDFYCSGAVTVNLWHGVPWKMIGSDVTNHQSRLLRLYGSYSHWIQRPTLTVALSEDFAKIIQSAFYIKSNNILRTGYPRNSIFYDPNTVSCCREKVLSLLREQNIAVDDNVRIITYMPTFRDNTQDVFSFEQIAEDSRMIKILQEQNAIIIQRAHFVSSQRGSDATMIDNPWITALDKISSQELLAATDLLITDYSSCFFDYLLLDRPIIHYLYDYEYYANNDRGLYYKKEDVICGDSAETIDELLMYMEENLTNPDKHLERRLKRKKKYMTFETKNSCKVIYDEIMKRLKCD